MDSEDGNIYKTKMKEGGGERMDSEDGDKYKTKMKDDITEKIKPHNALEKQNNDEEMENYTKLDKEEEEEEEELKMVASQTLSDLPILPKEAEKWIHMDKVRNDNIY